MNYYEHHLGDYFKDAGHLSMIEHGAYRLLLDAYYIREAPLPVDIKDCCKLARAKTKPERDAVAYVLREFFDCCPDGWHQDRADMEIERYQEGEPEREIKKANEKNRLNRHREERAALFRKITEAGQHAPWNIGINELREMVKRLDGNVPETPNKPLPATAQETASATPATATQTPDTKHQTPNLKPKTQSSASTAEPKAPPATPKPAPTAERAPLGDFVGLAIELRKAGVACTASHPRVIEWAGQGVTVEMALEAVQVARMRKPEGEPISANYLHPIIAEMRNPKPPPEPPWWNTPEATVAKGEAMGVTAKPGEQMAEYRERIREAIKGQQRAAA